MDQKWDEMKNENEIAINNCCTLLLHTLYEDTITHVPRIFIQHVRNCDKHCM